MIHQDTELRFISEEIGSGVFATARIPKGTIVFVKDPFDVEISPREFDTLPTVYKEIANKYSYIDERGVRILSWDHGKYVNHKCECNTMSTGYGFEIALRDIEAGEEITDEYGLLNVENEFSIACGCVNCRKMLRFDDIDNYYRQWDEKVSEALNSVKKVSQPLWDYMDIDSRSSLMDYLSGKEAYRSVYLLKYVPQGEDELAVSNITTNGWGKLGRAVNM